MLSDFIDKKFKEIEDYIESNRSRIKDDKKLLDAVSDRIKFWVEIASIITKEDLTVGDLQKILTNAGMEGSLTLKLNNIKEKLKILPSGSETKKENNTVSIGADKIISLKELVDMFDGKIVGIE